MLFSFIHGVNKEVGERPDGAAVWSPQVSSLKAKSQTGGCSMRATRLRKCDELFCGQAEMTATFGTFVYVQIVDRGRVDAGSKASQALIGGISLLRLPWSDGRAPQPPDEYAIMLPAVYTDGTNPER
jgi:hypothetical protein